MNENYLVYYRLNGEECKTNIFAVPCSPNLTPDEIRDFLVMQLKKLIRYDSTKHNLTILHVDKLN